MNKTMCPGQDTRYWRPDDIFNVPCGSCGASIEFFKDDTARRCSKCGTRVKNPRLSMGCAQWCQHAKECLGYDPREAAGADGTAARSVADRIIDALKLEFGAESAIVGRSLAAYEKARGLLDSFREATAAEQPRRCPICDRKMTKVAVGSSASPRLIDKCRYRDGLWFDGGELQEILARCELDPDSRIQRFLADVFGKSGQKSCAELS